MQSRGPSPSLAPPCVYLPHKEAYLLTGVHEEKLAHGL